MRTRINREKTYNKQEQAPSAELIFIGLRLVSVKVLNRYILFLAKGGSHLMELWDIYDKDKDYDVVDSVTNQVYLDNEHLKKAWGDNYIKNINKLKTAVNETFNEYLECDGQIADALFFSTSNGYTENSELVFNFAVSYLKSVSSPWDKEVTTAFKTTKEMSLQEFYERLNLPYQEKIKIENIDRSATNRILKIKINN